MRDYATRLERSDGKLRAQHWWIFGGAVTVCLAFLTLAGGAVWFAFGQQRQVVEAERETFRVEGEYQKERVRREFAEIHARRAERAQDALDRIAVLVATQRVLWAAVGGR